MNTELPKTYDPAAIEAIAWRTWTDANCFHAEPSDPGEPYSIVIPPPNVTGALHLGHAINNTLQDILIRVHRMRGYNTMWIPGVDHAGIATQAVVEKTIKEKEGKDRYSLAATPDASRAELIRRIWEWKDQFGARIVNQLKRLGCSCDWQRERFTLDEQCARAVRETFFKLFKDGLVYRGKRLVNWDTHLQTSISDDEIYHENVKTSLWHIRYDIVDAPQAHGLPSVGFDKRATFMTVATTRPETLLGDTAVAVHSQDSRWNWAIGLKVKLPLAGREIPIIADDILVDPKFGTGVVKVTPAHDPNDYAVYQRHLNQADAIDLINLMNPDGTLNDAAGERYKGLSMSAARKKVVEDLGDLLVKEEPYETQVGHSDRSKTPIQPYLSDQWFVKMAPLAEPALKVVEDGTIQFFPERHKQQYLSWLGEKRDWPISRQLWWGHRIPVWTKLVKDDADASRLTHELFDATAKTAGINPFDHRPFFYGLTAEDDAGRTWLHVGLGPDYPAAEELLVEQGFVQDPDVLDTWFSSALWPHSTLEWPEQTPDLAKWYPTSVLLTGRDIITLWVARMVMTGMYNMGSAGIATQLPPSPSRTPGGEGRGEGPSEASTVASADQRRPSPQPSVPSTRERGRELGIPFSHVVINPTILDGKGERMSKSKGNGVDPVDIIDTHGADALRFTLTGMATETQDVRLPVKKDAQGRNSSEKFDAGRNFCNKLWNAARFVLSGIEAARSDQGAGNGALSVREMQNTPATLASIPSAPTPNSQRPTPSLADRWIVSRLASTLSDANHALATYRFDHYAKVCYDFFWRDFCDWYVEAVKPAMKDPARAAATGNMLASVLDATLRLLHPIIPFITETIWWRLNDIAPQRGIADSLPCPPSNRLIKAAWPTELKIDGDVDRAFERVQTIIVAIRNLRSEHKVDPKRIVTVHVSPPGDADARAVLENREVIQTLATCAIQSVQPNLPAPPDAVSVIVNGDCAIYAEGLVDPAAERQRSAKRIDELTRQIAAMKGRLANAAYLAKAPAKLVEESQAQLAAAEAELAKLSS